MHNVPCTLAITNPTQIGKCLHTCPLSLLLELHTAFELPKNAMRSLGIVVLIRKGAHHQQAGGLGNGGTLVAAENAVPGWR